MYKTFLELLILMLKSHLFFLFFSSLLALIRIMPSLIIIL
jgi:hypothetical protein